MTGAAHWALPLLALAAGLVVGAWAAVVAWRRERGNPGTEAAVEAVTLADLEERAHICVAQLRELEEQRQGLDAEHYATERALYESRAAEALRQREELRSRWREATRADSASDQSGDQARAMAFLAARPQLRGALWGGGVVAVVAAVYGLVGAEPSAQHPARAQAAGGTEGPAAAEKRSGGPAGRAKDAHDEQIRSLYSRVEQHPDDVEALVALAHRLLSTMVLDEARRVNDRALDLQPDNLEARVHDAVLRAAAGEPQAEATLDALLEDHPTVAEGWFFRGMLSMQRGDTDAMRHSFEQYVAHAPDGPRKERIRTMLLSGRMGSAPTTPEPHPDP